MKELTLAVVGIDHPNADKARTNRRSELMMTIPGDRVDLRPEPRNPHDSHAIGVWSARGVQVGYLTAERAPWIGGRMNAGEEVEAIFQGLAGAAGYIRVRFGGGAPTLPAGEPRIARPTPSGEDGFYPNEDGPDWGA
jgi:hypothetical protein